VSGWTECSMLGSGLLILIYVTCRMKCESLQSIGCFFLYPAFWLVLFPGFWLVNRPEMADKPRVDLSLCGTTITISSVHTDFWKTVPVFTHQHLHSEYTCILAIALIM
jgi:hypothetical protein